MMPAARPGGSEQDVRNHIAKAGGHPGERAVALLDVLQGTHAFVDQFPEGDNLVLLALARNGVDQPLRLIGGTNGTLALKRFTG